MDEAADEAPTVHAVGRPLSRSGRRFADVARGAGAPVVSLVACRPASRQTRPTSPTPPAPPVAPTSAPSLTWFSTALIVVCGILLPATTLLVEALTHMCADGFFDPLPTVGHVFAIAAVPLAGVVSLWVLKRRDAARIEAVIFAQAFAVAISGVYAVIFAPMTPVAAFGVMFWGLGLLPLSPLLSLIAGLRALTALRRLRRAAGLPAHRAILGGLAAGVGLLIALNIPATLTRVMLVRAASDDPAVSRSGIAWLRRLGQRDLMLRAASSRARGEFDLVERRPGRVRADPVRQDPGDLLPRHGTADRGRARAARRRRAARPAAPGRRALGREPGRRPGRRDRAGAGLSLRSSRFDGSVDARAAVAYVEWTFELQERRARPARSARRAGAAARRRGVARDAVDRRPGARGGVRRARPHPPRLRACGAARGAIRSS